MQRNMLRTLWHACTGMYTIQCEAVPLVALHVGKQGMEADFIVPFGRKWNKGGFCHRSTCLLAITIC